MHQLFLAPLLAGLLFVTIGRADAQSATPPDTLTFSEAVQRAQSSNPALRAAGFEKEATEAIVSQSGRLGNPTLHFETENLGASGSETTQATLVLSQPIELGGDRSARRAVAQADVDLATSALDLALVRLVADVRTRFATAIAAQDGVRLAAESLELAETARYVTSEQVDAGDRSPVDLTRAEVAVAEAQAHAARANAKEHAAFSALAMLWREAPDFAAVESIEVELSVPPYELLTAGLAASPTLARFAVETARREAVVRLERAHRIPNPTISAGYRQFFDPGAGAFVVGIALPLPVFDRNSGNVAAARARLAAVDAEQDAFLIEAQTLLAEAYGELTASAVEARILRLEALPRAEDVADRIDEGYREGKFELLDVLDARRTLVALRSNYMDALAAFRGASADVARLLGLADLTLTSIEQIPTPDQP